jgi:hypothetical protein
MLWITSSVDIFTTGARPAPGLEEPKENGTAAGHLCPDRRPNKTNRGLGSRSCDTLAAPKARHPPRPGGWNCH